MTLQALNWYRVKNTRQFCQVTGIASTASPDVQVQKVDGNLNGFHVYLLWFTSSGPEARTWTKRAILMDLPKALRLLRDPAEEDRAAIAELSSTSSGIPLSSTSIDGVRTEPGQG